MINLYNENNKTFNFDNLNGNRPNIIFADFVYEDVGFSSWVDRYYDVLDNNGIIIFMSDWHSDYRIRMYMEDVIKSNFVNHLVQKNEWGHPPSKMFHQCFDSILIYSKAKTWKFDGSKIQVPKVTAKSKGLNPSGRETKNATCWVDDCTLTTGANERIVKDDGHLIRWQKSEKLVKRVFSPFYAEGDLILDPFMGSGTSGKVAMDLNCDYVGIELDEEPFLLAKKRLGLA